MRKLAVYLPSMRSGGAERLHLHLAAAFKEAGYDVTLLLQNAEGALIPLIPPGVRVVSLGCNRTLTSFFPLMRFLKAEKPDILLSNLGHNNILSIWAAALACVHTRVIASFHSVFSAEASAGANWQYRILPLLCRIFLGQAHGVVAVSNGVADDLAASTGLARQRITVIYNPVVFPDFNRRMAEPVTHPWLAAGAPPVLLGVGRLVTLKDFATLIRAFALVSPKRESRLIVLGEGELRGNLLALAESLGIKDRVDLPGFVENPLPFMKKASILVMSSLYEGFGNALVEALACGTPVVSTDCPYGPAEILENGKFGRLVPVGDAKALADAITATLDNPLPAATLQARGREFTVARAVKQYTEIFTSQA